MGSGAEAGGGTAGAGAAEAAGAAETTAGAEVAGVGTEKVNAPVGCGPGTTEKVVAAATAGATPVNPIRPFFFRLAEEDRT